MARWFIRKNILGIEEEIPEILSNKKQKFFIAYAISTWIYRFFLFLGIAILVYYYAFKVLGIILFLVEIIWFIFLPIYKELKVWWMKRKILTFNKKNKISLLIFLFFILLVFLPWNSNIKMPAIIESKNYFEYYTPEDGYIENIFFTNGEIVKKGQLLLKLKSPELEYKISQINEEIELSQLELNKQAGFKENLDKRFILEESLLKKMNELEGLKKVAEKFEIKASFDGKIYFYNNYKENQWVNKKEPIFVLYDNLDFKITGFCNENDLNLLKENAKSKFIFNSGDLDNITSNVTTISKVSVPYLEYSELSSNFGGTIPTREDSNKKVKTEQAYYKITIDLDNYELDLKSRKVGVLISQGESSSIISRIIKKSISVIIRESGF